MGKQPSQAPGSARTTAVNLRWLIAVGLLGLVGLLWMLWPRPPAIERGQLEGAGEGAVAWEWRAREGRALLRGETMGTSYSVVLASPKLDAARIREIGAQVAAELEAVNAQMSTYRPDSELSRFNRAPAGEPVEVSPELAELVALAEEISVRSEGAFDVTVGPLVDAWGFGAGSQARGEARGEVPDEATLEALRAVVGHDKLAVNLDPAGLTKAVEGLQVDLSAIAKGHGADRVAAVLDAAGQSNYMVEIGGEVRVRGHNHLGEPWRVGIERPTADARGERVVAQIIGVSDASVATSGDYRNYWEAKGHRYSHTLDPRTGRPVTHRLASVTVIHPTSAAHADAWATALNVLGPEAGLARAEAEGLAAYFLVRTDEGFERRASAAFSNILAAP